MEHFSCRQDGNLVEVDGVNRDVVRHNLMSNNFVKDKKSVRSHVNCEHGFQMTAIIQMFLQ